jgi:hypothetical protein
MRAILTVMLLGLFLGLLAVFGCDEDGTATGPGGGDIGEDASATIEGYQLGHRSREALMRVSSAEYDTSVVFSWNSTWIRGSYKHIYQLTGIAQGLYTITPDMSACSEEDQELYVFLPVSRTVSIGPGINRIDHFFVFSREDSIRYAEEGLCCIGGMIDYDSPIVGTSGIRIGTTLWIRTPEGTFVDSLTTSSELYSTGGPWNGIENDLPRGKYTVTPENQYFAFDPPSRTVHANESAAVANFNAVYSGEERYTFRVVLEFLADYDQYWLAVSEFQEGIVGSRVYSCNIMDYNTNLIDGSVTSSRFLPGTYWLEINKIQRGTTHSQVITITDHDIDLGEIDFEYAGPLNYHISGRAVDDFGVGISGVKVSMEGRPVDAPNIITWPVTTDEEGSYQFGYTPGFKTEEDLSLTITPEKTGWTFSPQSAVVTYAFDESDEYINFSIPDIIGTPITIAPFFPLDTGASWTFTRAIDDIVSDPVTVTAGTSFSAGGQSYIPLDGSMFSVWKGFRSDGARMYAWNGTDAVTYATLEESQWDMGKVDRYPASGRRLNSEDVTVPAGTFADCEVIEIAVVYGETSSETTTVWLAEDVGPVKIEFVTVSRGKVIGRISDELTSYSIP